MNPPHTMEIIWQNEKLDLLPEKAIHWKKGKTLFLADPHFGKAATFRQFGIPVPELTTEDDCKRLQKIVSQTQVEVLFFLGDFLHSKQGKTEPVRMFLFRFRELFPDLAIHLVRGNHDLHAGDPWPELKISCHAEPFSMEKWDCRHTPTEKSPKPYLAGHLHPGFSMRLKNRFFLKAACFWVNPSKIILPAFGSFTGLKNVKPETEDKIFLTKDGEVVPLK